jgi:hypothetical protein
MGGRGSSVICTLALLCALPALVLAGCPDCSPFNEKSDAAIAVFNNQSLLLPRFRCLGSGTLIASDSPLLLAIEYSNYHRGNFLIGLEVTCPPAKLGGLTVRKHYGWGTLKQELDSCVRMPDVSHEDLEICRDYSTGTSISVKITVYASANSSGTFIPGVAPDLDRFQPLASISSTFTIIGNGLSTAYIVISCVSFLCCVIVLWLTLRYPGQLGRFPNNLVQWRISFDALFALTMIYVNTSLINNGTSQVTCNPFIALLTQFSLLGSLSWYFMLALNTYYSISNPFRRPESLTSRYHAFVWTLSIATGIVTAFFAGM